MERKMKNILVEIKSDKEVFEDLRQTVKGIKAGEKVTPKETLVFSNRGQMKEFYSKTSKRK